LARAFGGCSTEKLSQKHIRCDYREIKRGNDAADEVVWTHHRINTGWIFGQGGLGSPQQSLEFPIRKIIQISKVKFLTYATKEPDMCHISELVFIASMEVFNKYGRRPY
jgi:hypothetical protein